MKSIIFLLLVMCANISEAKVYKCTKEEDGSYIYQSKPCENRQGEPEEDELEIMPYDAEKGKAALEKLEKEVAIYNEKKEKVAKEKQDATAKLIKEEPKKTEEKPAKKVRAKRWTDRRKQ